MSSPNAYAYPFNLVLVMDGYSIDGDIGEFSVMVESRRVENGIYFHFESSHTFSHANNFSQLASPTNPPRGVVDTYIV